MDRVRDRLRRLRRVGARGEDGQVQGFLVERGTPGYEATVIEGKASLRAIHNAAITLDGVRVPAENKLPGRAASATPAASCPRRARGIAWGALGHATAAYETALAYSLERKQFGQPLASFQLVQDKLVQMLAEVTAMQLFCLRWASSPTPAPHRHPGLAGQGERDPQGPR